MMFIDSILSWARAGGYAARYGSPSQVNEYLTDVDFSSSRDGVTVFCHLIRDSETVDGRDRADVAVYFAALMDFDFNGEGLLPLQERLKGFGKEMLHDFKKGNTIEWSNSRWQYGYDDYAENVAWVCLRVTFEASAADCWPLVLPGEEGA